MHIAMIGPRKLFPHPEAGLDCYVREWSEYLVRLGHQVTIYCHKSKEGSSDATISNLKIIPIWTLKKHHLDTLCYGFSTSIHLLFQKADIIHYHGGSSLFAWIAKLKRKKIVVTLHSQEWRFKHVAWYWRPFYFLGEWLGVKAADCVTCVSQTLQQELQKRYSKKILCIPLGFSSPSCQSAAKLLSIGLQPKNYLLFLGRLERGKGIELLLQAFNVISQQTPHSLVIAGKPLYDQGYFQKLKALAGPKVLFLGKVSGTLKEELLANALLYVQASQAEGLSLSLLEAMSYGIPVLVSDIPQNIEAVGNAGFFFKNKDAEDLQVQMKKLLFANTGNLEQMGKKARQKIQTEHSWERVRQRIQELYSL